MAAKFQWWYVPVGLALGYAGYYLLTGRAPPPAPDMPGAVTQFRHEGWAVTITAVAGGQYQWSAQNEYGPGEAGGVEDTMADAADAARNYIEEHGLGSGLEEGEEPDQDEEDAFDVVETTIAPGVFGGGGNWPPQIGGG